MTGGESPPVSSRRLIVLSAIYTLNMIQKVFYGSANAATGSLTDIGLFEQLSLVIIVLIILIIGVYPQPLIDLTQSAVNNLLVRI